MLVAQDKRWFVNGLIIKRKEVGLYLLSKYVVKCPQIRQFIEISCYKFLYCFAYDTTLLLFKGTTVKIMTLPNGSYIFSILQMTKEFSPIPYLQSFNAPF